MKYILSKSAFTITVMCVLIISGILASTIVSADDLLDGLIESVGKAAEQLNDMSSDDIYSGLFETDADRARKKYEDKGSYGLDETDVNYFGEWTSYNDGLFSILVPDGWITTTIPDNAPVYAIEKRKDEFSDSYFYVCVNKKENSVDLWTEISRQPQTYNIDGMWHVHGIQGFTYEYTKDEVNYVGFEFVINKYYVCTIEGHSDDNNLTIKYIIATVHEGQK